MTYDIRIGELATRTGCQIETIRYYERERLLPQPRRTAGNFRLYSLAHVDRLNFIRHCRALDMTLQEIRSLLKYYDAPHVDCGGAREVIDVHMVEVARRIVDLKMLQKRLAGLRALCNKEQAAGDCGMLHQLTTSPRVGSPKMRTGDRVRPK